jgi:hypothetical protein
VPATVPVGEAERSVEAGALNATWPKELMVGAVTVTANGAAGASGTVTVASPVLASVPEPSVTTTWSVTAWPQSVDELPVQLLGVGAVNSSVELDVVVGRPGTLGPPVWIQLYVAPAPAPAAFAFTETEDPAAAGATGGGTVTVTGGGVDP